MDQEALAKIEAEDALLYLNIYGRWPENMSVRAWRYAQARWPDTAK